MGKNDKKKNDKNEDDRREQKLQAILLADSFTKTFRPITWNKPKVLLPLVNVPMLEYTIEFLAQNGVEELFVFCVWHAKLLQTYINDSKWPSTISVRCITSTSCLSAGDALRELDSMGIIRSDPFILISGDVISNMDLKKAIAFHKEKRKLDSNCMMTIVLKNVQKMTGVKAVMDDLVVGIKNETSQVLFYEDNVRKDFIQLPIQIIQDNRNISFHTDILDCHVDICSPEVLLQFSDNFDYQNIRKHFIQNEVVNWELGLHVYGYLLQNEYASRVHDPRTYHYICRDIVSRWVYPLVPDSPLTHEGTYTQSRRFCYREDNVKVARSAHIGEGVVIGSGSVIGHGAVLSRCVIGRNCVVGDNSVVKESHLWTGAVVEESSSVSYSIVCEGALVKKRAVVRRGCVLAERVVVGEGVTLPEYTRVSLSRRCQAEEEDEEAEEPDVSTDNTDSSETFDVEVLGHDGVGYSWQYEGGGDYDVDEDEEEELEGQIGVDIMKASSAGCKEEELWKRSLWLDVAPPEDSSDEEEVEEDNGFQTSMPVSLNDVEEEDVTGEISTETLPPVPNSNNSNKKAAVSAFDDMVHELVASSRDTKIDNILLEIKGLKFAHNKEFSDCIAAATPAFLEVSLMEATNSATSGGSSSSQQQVATVSAMKRTFGEGGRGRAMLKALIQNSDDELVLIAALELFTVSSPHKSVILPVFRLILQILYDADVVSEESLQQWIAERRRGELSEEDSMSAYRADIIGLFKQPQVQAFVDWLEEDDEEDDEEEED